MKKQKRETFMRLTTLFYFIIFFCILNEGIWKASPGITLIVCVFVYKETAIL